MKEFIRNIPEDLNASILYPITGGLKKDPLTPELYVEKIQAFERKVEESLIGTFNRLNIYASVKSDPYSLPYKEEIVITLRGESYLNGAYEIFRVAPIIVKKLLNDDINQLRFYVYVEIDTSRNGLINTFGKVNYHFRYYPKS